MTLATVWVSGMSTASITSGGRCRQRRIRGSGQGHADRTADRHVRPFGHTGIHQRRAFGVEPAHTPTKAKGGPLTKLALHRSTGLRLYWVNVRPIAKMPILPSDEPFRALPSNSAKLAGISAQQQRPTGRSSQTQRQTPADG